MSKLTFIYNPRKYQLKIMNFSNMRAYGFEKSYKMIIDACIITYVIIDDNRELLSIIDYYKDNILQLHIRYVNCLPIMNTIINIINSNNLQKLYLVGSCPKTHTNKIIHYLEQNKNLQKLSFSSNELTDDTVIKSLVQLLKKKQYLQKIFFGACNLQHNSIYRILNSIKNHKHIIRLCLMDNNLDNPQICKQIAKIIKNNVIYQLDLDRCSITDVNFKYIYNALKHNSSLKRLHMTHNNLFTTNLSIDFFKILMKYNVQLHVLSLSNMAMNKFDHYKYLGKYLKINKSLHMLGIKSCFDEKRITYIYMKLLHNDTLHTLYSGHINLCLNYNKAICYTEFDDTIVTKRNKYNKIQRHITLIDLLKN